MLRSSDGRDMDDGSTVLVEIAPILSGACLNTATKTT